jgi:hypothetical protein
MQADKKAERYEVQANDFIQSIQCDMPDRETKSAEQIFKDEEELETL